MTMAAILMVVSVLICWFSTPSGAQAVTAEMMGVDVTTRVSALPPRARPGEWLECSPLVTILVVGLTAVWMLQEFASTNPIIAISNLNTYNLIFLMLGFLLHWRPRSFLDAVAKAVPATTGVLIQFPLYGAIAVIMTTAKGYGGHSLTELIAAAFVRATITQSFPVVMGATCGADLAGIRDRALLLLGFAGALRRSELIGIDLAHLRPTPVGMRLLIARSKTDKPGGQTRTLTTTAAGCGALHPGQSDPIRVVLCAESAI
jgi:hypothetical protein